MKKQNIKVPYSAALATLASEIYKKKTRKEFLDLSPKARHYVYLQGDASEAGSCDNSLLRCHTEVSSGEFITALEALPDYKDKNEPMRFSVRDINVTIYKREVTVGCQVYSEENVKAITAAVNDFLNSFKTIKLEGKKGIRVDPRGIFCDGVLVSFEEFKTITEKYKESQ